MRRLVLLLVMAGGMVFAQQQPLPVITPTIDDARTAFQQRDFNRAQELLNQIVQADPQNIFAHNLLGNCALELGNYAAAAQSFQRALQIQPDQPQNLSGLARAFTQAGLTSERDDLVKHLRELSKAGKLPKDYGYVFDAFTVGDKKLLVTEFPELAGRFHFRYRFDMYDAANRLLYRYAVESDDIDQSFFAKEHPKEAAEGKRSFSLDGYGQNTHATVKFYSDGEPSYETARADVQKAVTGAMKPMSSIQMNRAPAPQSSPGPPASPK